MNDQNDWRSIQPLVFQLGISAGVAVGSSSVAGVRLLQGRPDASLVITAPALYSTLVARDKYQQVYNRLSPQYQKEADNECRFLFLFGCLNGVIASFILNNILGFNRVEDLWTPLFLAGFGYNSMAIFLLKKAESQMLARRQLQNVEDHPGNLGAERRDVFFQSLKQLVAQDRRYNVALAA